VVERAEHTIGQGRQWRHPHGRRSADRAAFSHGGGGRDDPCTCPRGRAWRRTSRRDTGKRA
jgi:hypothetical protein